MKTKQPLSILTISLGAGILLGYLLGRRSTEKRQPKVFTLWQRLLAEERGEVEAAFFIARVRSRYSELLNGRPRLKNRALRTHLESNILPGLALYQEFRQSDLDQEAALENATPLIIARVLNKRPQLEVIGQQPFFFRFLRLILPLTMRNFPQEGWKMEWLEVSGTRIAFNMYSCFYLDTLTEYGAPELTPAYCLSDDALLEGLSPYLLWERTQTLGRGGELCNFCFRPAIDGHPIPPGP